MGVPPARVAVAAIAAFVLMGPSAASGARPALDATRSFTAVSGYFDSAGPSCPDNVKTGPGETFTLLGTMWIEGDVLKSRMNLGGFDDVDYTGTLGDDGAFALTGPDHLYPNVTERFAGVIDLSGIIAPGSEITVPYLEDCIKHGLITDGHVNMPTPKVVSDAAAALETAPLHRRPRVWRISLPFLRPYEINVPGLLLAERLVGFRVEGPYAVSRARSALRHLRRASATTAYRLLSAQAHLTEAVPSDSHLYLLAKREQRLANAGIGLSKLEGKDSVLLGAVEKGTKLVKAGVTLSELRRSDKEHAGRLVEDLVDLVPAGLKSGITGPGQVVFSDLQKWNEKTWKSTTKGLDVVSKALDTGHVDRKRLKAVERELKSLSNGPWTKQTPINFVKKTAEEIPVLGTLLKAVWD